MDIFDVMIEANIQATFRVIADDEEEAAARAELIFRNDNCHQILAVRCDVRSDVCGTRTAADR